MKRKFIALLVLSMLAVGTNSAHAARTGAEDRRSIELDVMAIRKHLPSCTVCNQFSSCGPLIVEQIIMEKEFFSTLRLRGFENAVILSINRNLVTPVSGRRIGLLLLTPHGILTTVVVGGGSPPINVQASIPQKEVRERLIGDGEFFTITDARDIGLMMIEREQENQSRGARAARAAGR